MATREHKPLTAHDLARAVSENPDARLELLDGSLSEAEAPVYDHGRAQSQLGGRIALPFHRKGGREDGTGGWWIASEVDVQLGPHTVVRPDISGWRRDRHPRPPTEHWPVRARPDWVCEVVSPKGIRRDLVVKRRLYWEAGVTWYWMVHIGAGFVDVLRYTSEGYVPAANALPVEGARLPPFQAVDLDLRPVFGIGDED